MIICLIVISACSFDSGSTIVKTIKYEVTGTVPLVDISYHNFTETTDDLKNVSLPWEKTFSVAIEHHNSFFAHLWARSYGTSGTVTASIYVDDVVVKTATGSSSASSLSYFVRNY